MTWWWPSIQTKTFTQFRDICLTLHSQELYDDDHVIGSTWLPNINFIKQVCDIMAGCILSEHIRIVSQWLLEYSWFTTFNLEYEVSTIARWNPAAHASSAKLVYSRCVLPWTALNLWCSISTSYYVLYSIYGGYRNIVYDCRIVLVYSERRATETSATSLIACSII